MDDDYGTKYSYNDNKHKHKHIDDDDYYYNNSRSDAQQGEASNSHIYLLIAASVPAAIQVIVMCVLIFVLVYYYSKARSCSNNREIWCMDDWYCNKQTISTDQTYNKCYQQKVHLASCLFGPHSKAAMKCIDFSKKGVACPCVISAGSDTTKGSSCLAGCPAVLKKASKKTVCCCVPGTPGCTNKTLPPECKS